MSVLDTAEYRRLALIAAGVDPSEIPCILDTATWRRLMLAALYDLSQGGGGSPGYVNGSVRFYADLPVTVGTPAVNTAYLVREDSGIWFINRKPAGIYVRLFNNGVLADWDYAGEFPSVNDSQYFRIYDTADPTREIAFSAASISSGQIRTITVPDKNVTLDDAGDPRTPTAHTHPASQISDSTAAGRALLTGADAAAQRTSLGLGTFATANAASPPAIGNTTPATGAFTTLSAAPTSGSALTLTGGTVTASAPLIDATQTWNNAATIFTGLQFSVTPTAADHRSTILSINEGATQAFGIQTVIGVPPSQAVRVFGGSRGIRIGSRVTSGAGSADFIGIRYQTSTFTMLHGTEFGWSSLPYDTAPDLSLHRDAADTLAQRRTSNAQTFRIYNTFTDANNYERGFMRWSSNVLQIGTERLGTGSARSFELSVDGNRRFSISAVNAEVNIGSSTGLLSSHGICVSVAGQQTSIAHGTGRILVTSTVVTMNSDVLRVDSGRVMFGGTTSSFPALKRSSTTLQVRLADDSAFAPFECAGLTLNGDLTASTRNIVTDTTTGTRIGTGTTQRLGFWNATPTAQPAAVADATDAASTQDRLNDLLARLRTLGLIAT